MRLIDADEIPYTTLYKENFLKGTGVEAQGAWKSDIDNIQTVDAVPVRQGKWVEYPKCLEYENALTDEHIVCSCCGEVFNVMDNDTYRFKYCPNCGARMKEE